MKYHFKLSDKEGLNHLREDWLIFLYDFFEEKTVFHVSQATFLAFLDPPTIRPHGYSRMLLFAHNRGDHQKVFESSISVGLLQGRYISRIKHAPSFKFAVQPKELVCIEFPVKGNRTPAGKYRIGIRVKDCRERVKSLGEKFSLNFAAECVSQSIAEFISGWIKIPSQVITGWALQKVKNKRIHISKTDILYLGMTTGTHYAAEAIETPLEEEIEKLSAEGATEYAGTALSGVADGIFSEMVGVHLPSLTLTVK